MSAIQLLEQLGADASKRASASDIFNQSQIGDAEREGCKIWCALIPEKDDDEEDGNDDNKDGEQLTH